MMQATLDSIKAYLLSLQQSLTTGFEALEPSARFVEDKWQRAEGGGGITRTLSGDVIEKGGVNFSHVYGDTMPASATAQRPALAGRAFQAMGVSVVMHPHNPKAPTSHANVRFFVAEKAGEAPIWWFGGGYDLTPYYLYEEDAVFWHQTAKAACDQHSADYYPRFKTWCDEYFYLKHRAEARGIGGVFYDDFNAENLTHAFDFTRSIGDSYGKAYIPILTQRHNEPFTEAEKQFQLHRRGRYVEFNLVYDRGTLFGLQSGGRTESILMSLPPLVRWTYDYQVPEGSNEALLLQALQTPRDWLND